MAARRVASLVPVRVTTTLLAAHAVPPEFEGRADDYIEHVVMHILPEAARVRFEVEAPADVEVEDCNCSICLVMLCHSIESRAASARCAG